MEVVVLAQAQRKEIATAKTVQASICSCFCAITANAPSYPFMRNYVPEKKTVPKIHLRH